jgi:hypothetical protein
MSEQTIKLELSIDEVNLILEALGDQPFKAVYALVARLQSQARSQLGDSANPSSAAPDDSPSSAVDPDASQTL